ncbi:ABC transporter permease [Pelagibacterium halotolerans]|uniref:Dipeptide transport system permease protein DppB n=1 Tax=Pelagibacterium halotolerans (strain DSM 22347 / JCM 15775 / CGMCC 1.7692 / B2) TaxID=1082931 RepID=G4RBK6_PELHB|nr:ABC transporter permease [Pelagibacterium halotolerans]AEQ53647.1 dipeptide transport system permease protein DppB [Pelagibacterium halotolerans B2]QJR20181.1 ABC transporter permease [Pelagibacterium halotolerans]SEA90988.1 peptide/nickel transport system permease protein [Pelagibacterium halotolerans]
MLAYVARRLLLMIPMAIGMVVITFGLLLLIPGDPAAVLLGQEASAEAIENLRNSLGLNDPWYLRLWDYFAGLLQGDMGTSIFQNRPVASIIATRLGATLELAIVSLILATVIGLTLGVIAAIRQGSWVDTATMLFAQLGVSMPVYWLGLLLMLAFAVMLGWLPAVGRGVPLPEAIGAMFAGNFGPIWDSLSHLALPAIALAANSAAVISRLVRASMLEVLREDFVRTAYAKGLRRPRVVIRHALRNALLPVLSIIGLRFGALLGGAVLTESIFAWPGLGQLTISAISQRDLPLIQGIVLTFAIIFALVNLIVDLLYAAVDPRIRLG